MTMYNRMMKLPCECSLGYVSSMDCEEHKSWHEASRQKREEIMSRSKRAPVHTQGYGGVARKASKRSATKAIRNKAKDAEVPSGQAFKKEYSSWDIVDFKFHDPKNPKVRRK